VNQRHVARAAPAVEWCSVGHQKGPLLPQATAKPIRSQSLRNARNSRGPLISLRLRFACSTGGADLSLRRSTAYSAIPDALAAAFWLCRVGLDPPSPISINRRAASDKVGLSVCWAAQRWILL
jgi:hypothetical protein